MLERILQFSIHSRHVVVMLAVLVAALGAAALHRLPIDAVPDITSNQVIINTMFPALTPVEVEKQITVPIETALAGIPGLAHTRSFSRNGFSQITAVFDDDVDVYFARNQINERLTVAREGLPAGASPFLGPITTGLGEIYMYVVEYEHPRGVGATAHDGRPGWQSDGSYKTPEGDRLTSDFELATYLRTVQDWVIRPQLRRVEGVASVDSNGGYVKQYHVQPDPMTLLSYGLTFTDVIEALERNNVATGAGFVERLGEAYTVRADARLANVAEIENVPVGSRNGFPIHVRDVARVVPGREPRMGSASENGREIVLGTALMLVKSNSRTVAAAVDAKLEEVRRSLPPDVRARTVLDRKHLVDATIKTVVVNLAEGAALVIFVLFLLLGNFRAAFICALAIPLSMLMAVAGMVQTKTSGNLMSLGAIDFGLIIDGAIIIVENCLRRLAERQHATGRLLTLEERLEEVGLAAREMIRPSVFGQAIIVTVYLPILALTGIEGKMFEPMAVTVILALASAFVLSLTLVPALVAILVRGRVREGDNVLVAAAKRLYAPVLAAAMRARALVVLAAIVVFAASAWLFTRLGSEFTPNLDEHDVVVMATRPLSTGIDQSTRMQFDLEHALETIPEVRVVFSRTGTAEMATDPMMPCLSDTFIVLKSREDWPDPKLPKADLIRRMEDIVAAVPGNSYEFTQPIQMRFNELIAGVRSDVAVQVYGDDFGRMEATAREIASVLGRIRGAADVKVEQTDGLPVMNVVADREAAARLGVDMVEVQDLVSAAIGGREAGVVFEGDRRVDVIVRLDDAGRADRAALCDLPLRIERSDGEHAPGDHEFGESSGAGFVPLCTVARIDLSSGPHQVSRYNGKRMITVQANVRGRDLGGFVAEAQQRVNVVGLPPGGWLEWGGQFENLAAAKERFAFVVPVCFFLIFLLLYSAFRSVTLAIAVFSGVPLGLTGGIVALWLRDIPFSITAAVGFIALSGVAVLNGLVMVSAIDRLRREGVGVDEAIRTGSLTRLRPVLMTALVASLGFLPMAIATGTGAEVQRPLATVVIGGLVSSTLVVLPALYRMMVRGGVFAASSNRGDLRG